MRGTDSQDRSVAIACDLRAHVLSGRREGIDVLLEHALGAQMSSAGSIYRDVLLPAMQEVIDRGRSGALILPEVLSSAEVMTRAVSTLGPDLTPRKGSIAIATLEGDVHGIGKGLLVALLSAGGYTVYDLGRQIRVDRIIEAALDLRPDTLGLSALLVSTSRQMPICIQELDRRGIHLPVLIGGAAINRTFGRRAAILPDGRVYEPGVFYCKDVFEGLATMDSLADPSQRANFIQEVRGEIEAERDGIKTLASTHVIAPSSLGPRRDVEIPRPPFWGTRKIAADLREVWRAIDRNTLFRFHWGGYQAKGADYDRLVHEVFEPTLAELMQDAERIGWLEPLIVSGYFACNASGDELIVFDPLDATRELVRLAFPRQCDNERLCVADYFRPVESGERDVVVLQAVSTGPRAGEYIDELQHAGEYRRMLYVNGLASSTAEALADHAHALARRELSLPAGRGLRLSWGYAACPDLEEQRKVLPLLRAEQEIGLTLTLSNNLDPEHSTAAIVLHHPEAKYFSVRSPVG